MVQNPLEIQEKNSKKFFFGYLSQYLMPFFKAKKIFKFFLAAVSTRYYHRKKSKKTHKVPGAKYGFFRYFENFENKFQQNFRPEIPSFRDRLRNRNNLKTRNIKIGSMEFVFLKF
jgi:hypothetical protein